MSGCLPGSYHIWHQYKQPSRLIPLQECYDALCNIISKCICSMNNSGHIQHRNCCESGWNCSNSWGFTLRLLNSCLIETRNDLSELVVPFGFFQNENTLSYLHLVGIARTETVVWLDSYLFSVDHSFCFLFGQIRSVAKCQDLITSDIV